MRWHIRRCTLTVWCHCPRYLTIEGYLIVLAIMERSWMSHITLSLWDWEWITWFKATTPNELSLNRFTAAWPPVIDSNDGPWFLPDWSRWRCAHHCRMCAPTRGITKPSWSLPSVALVSSPKPICDVTSTRGERREGKKKWLRVRGEEPGCGFIRFAWRGRHQIRADNRWLPRVHKSSPAPHGGLKLPDPQPNSHRLGETGFCLF